MTCKLFHYHSWGSSITASYHVMAMALDRVLAIKAPYWHMQHSCRQLATRISVLCATLCYCAVLPNFYFFTTHNPPGGECSMSRGTLPTLLTLYSATINYLVFSTVPFLAVLFANIVFIHALNKRGLLKNTKSAQSLAKTSANSNLVEGLEGNPKVDIESSRISQDKKDEKPCRNLPFSRSKSHLSVSNFGEGCSTNQRRTPLMSSMKRKQQFDRSYVILMLSITCSFMTLTILAALINNVAIKISLDPEADPAKTQFYQMAVELPMLMNNSLNFLFYISSSRMFRKAFIERFGKMATFLKLHRCCKCWQQNLAVNTTQNNSKSATKPNDFIEMKVVKKSDV